MTTGQYLLFCMAAIACAIVLVFIKNRQVEQEDGGVVEVTFTGHQIEGRAMRCAQQIGARIGLGPRGVQELKKGLVYVHHEFLGVGSPRDIADQFGVDAVEKLQAIGEFKDGWDAEEVATWIADIVAGSLSVDEPETVPMQG